MTPHNPSENPNALDLASFYVEELKYGPGPGEVEVATVDDVREQLTKLLADANISNITAEEILKSIPFYSQTYARILNIDAMRAGSVWYDGLLHGIALSGKLEGEIREPMEE